MSTIASTIRFSAEEDSALEEIKKTRMLSTKAQAVRFAVLNVLTIEEENKKLQMQLYEVQKKFTDTLEDVRSFAAAWDKLRSRT